LGKALLLALALGLPAAAARGEDLLEVYRDAQRYDAVYSAARYALEAGREKLPQGRALLLPSINLSANASRNRNELDSKDTTVTPSFERSPRVYGYQLTLSQPLFRMQNFYQYDQGELQAKQAEAAFGQATQDLMLRVAQAYFDVLAAQDGIALVRAQKAAISEQLAQAKRNFEVGTATIVDTHEAQARYDLSAAQEIAVQNELESRKRALQQITGKEYPAGLKPLRGDVKLSPPEPNDMQSWVDLAEKQSYAVQLQDASTQIAALEAKRNSAAHLPTVDIVASRGVTDQTSTLTSPVGNTLTTTSIGLQLNLPIYQGGLLSSREREAAALALKSKDDLENARRSAALTARQAYLAVINGVAQVGALEQARLSSQSALDSNKVGYEVGVRINIDVLNSQQQLYSTERDLAVARYNTIANQLRLKAAAGSLGEQDLEAVNRALAP
jgi:outer membrane protein